MHSTLEGFTDGTSQPFYSIDFIESTRIKFMTNTGKSLSEALIFALTNPQYDDRLFIGLSPIHENSKLKHGENMLCTEIVSDIQKKKIT